MAERINMAENPQGPNGEVGNGAEVNSQQDILANAFITVMTNPQFLDLLGQKLVERQGALQQGVDQRGERLQRPQSTFRQTIDRIEQLQQQPSSPDRDAALAEMIQYRDRLRREARDLGLFNSSKIELSGLLYDARVKVTNSAKEGKDEYEGRGKLHKLSAVQQVSHDPDWVVRDQQTAQALQGEKIFQGEVKTGIWSSSLVKNIEQRYADRGHQVILEQRYGGVVDDFYQNTIDIIVDVVRDRKRYTLSTDSYPDPIINDLWDGPVVDVSGNVLKDEEGQNVIADSFNDVRAAIEEARRQEPWVPNRADYETYIKFVADDVEEFEEMIPYIVAKVIRKLGNGQPEKLNNRLESEKERLDGALVNFHVETEAEFRRLKSTLANNLDLMGAYFFSEKIQDDWGAYLNYLNSLAIATENTEQQDHLVDALFLDKDGLTVLAVNQFCKDDGIFWRYGQNSADIATKAYEINKLFRWQENKRKEIGRFLMANKLKSMGVLLGIEPDQNGSTATHPAFQRLKDQFALLDEADKAANNGNILDADGNPTTQTRWAEYCTKALNWQKTGRFGDPRDAERVTFEHPLARSFKPPTKNAQGQIQSELLDMFEEDRQVSEDKWYASTKRRKVKSIVQKAERISRVFMIDSAAALAWHVFQNDAQREEANKYLTAAGMDPLEPGEALPQKTLFRALMLSLVREDQRKQPKDKAFKIFYLLTEKLGIDIDIPTFGAWYIGAHDTTRPSVLLQAVGKDNQPGGLAEAMPARGMDEKNTGAMWAERERRLRLLMQMVMKAKFGGSGRYFNFPGHDTKGGGVKDVRNYLNLMYGTSTNTVWLNDLVKDMLPLEQEFPSDFGATRDPITQLVGLYKGGNEVVYAQSGYVGLIENPRDFKAHVKRTVTNVERGKILTSGNKEGYAMLKDGPFSGMYQWRDYIFSAVKNGGFIGDTPEDYLLKTSLDEARLKMHEATYKAGIDLAAKTIGPLIEVMKQTVDSTFGPNPGTARFANTLLWYAVSKWMDTSREYREKPGYAMDGNTHVARYFMHQYLLEYGNNGLIYDDKDFDEIMLGYVIKQDGTRVTRYDVEIRNGQQVTKDENGNWITGEIQEGLIDAFPEDLRKQILEGVETNITDISGKKIRDYWLPFGLKSKYPETFANYYQEGERVKKKYAGALAHVKSRRIPTRP